MTELTEKEKSVLEMYGCDETPLFYKIKPKGTIEFVASDKITKSDFENQD